MRLSEEEIKKYTADYFDIEFEEYPERVNTFLYFLKRQGYVRLAEDQELPPNPATKEQVINAKYNCNNLIPEYIYDTWNLCQNTYTDANFKKVEK